MVRLDSYYGSLLIELVSTHYRLQWGPRWVVEDDNGSGDDVAVVLDEAPLHLRRARILFPGVI